MSVRVVLTGTDDGLRHLDAEASASLIQDRATSGLPDRRRVVRLYLVGVEGSQTRVLANTRRPPAHQPGAAPGDPGIQELWKGTTHNLGPMDPALYLINDATEDYNGACFWGRNDDGSLDLFEFNFTPTLPDGNLPQ